MNKESQRIAIAEACGWNITNGYLAKGDTPFLHVGTLVTAWEQLDRHDPTAIPDYLNDFNAMHEAEKVLPDKICYVLILRQVLTREENDSQALDCYEIFNVAHATAAQRSEAFLKCLGLWKDEACPQSEISTTASH